MKIADVLKFIKETNGRFFSIKFEKRTTGEIREMLCRTGVTSHLVAVPSKEGLNFKKHNLIPVFDVKKEEYRSIPIEGITEIKIEGTWEKVEHD